MGRVQAVAQCCQAHLRVYGKLSPEAEQWSRTMNVVSKKFENYVAGFAR
jgi:hypothetical protein